MDPTTGSTEGEIPIPQLKCGDVSFYIEILFLKTVDHFKITKMKGTLFIALVLFLGAHSAPSDLHPTGSLDVANTATALGWACIPNWPIRPLFVEIYVDNDLVGTVLAITNRPDVANICGGDPLHGFSFTFPESVQETLTDGQPHTVSAFTKQAILIPRIQLNNSPRAVQAPNIPPKGFLDSASTATATGWACDENNFNTALRVDIYIDNNVFAGSTIANLPREAAVGQQCGGNSNHGFNFTFPSNVQNILNNGQPHTVTAIAINIPSGINPQLGGSPKIVQGT